MSKFCYLCDNKRNKEKNVSLHKFPLDRPVILNKWMYVCGLSLERDVVSGTKICSCHFLPTDFAFGSSSNRRLLPTAVPSENVFFSLPTVHSQMNETITAITNATANNLDQAVGRQNTIEANYTANSMHHNYCAHVEKGQNLVLLHDDIQESCPFVTDDDDVGDEYDKDTNDEEDEILPDRSTELVTPNAIKDNEEKSTQDVPDHHLRLKRTDYKCNECDRDIFGYRYVCVQCVEHDLCATCEACGAHALHYVLRVPADKPHHEAMAVLEKIREIVNIEKQENQDVPLNELECIKCEVETSSDPLNDENVVKIEIDEEPLEISEFEHAPISDEEATIEGNAQSAESQQRQQRHKHKAPSDTHTDTPPDALPNTQIMISLDRITDIIAKRNKMQRNRDSAPSSRNTNDSIPPTYLVPTDTKPNVNAPMTFEQVPGSVVPVIMYNIPKSEDRGGLQPDHTSAPANH